MNREAFKKIHDIISVEPEKLNMNSWENTYCGTTRCVAGWAIYNEINAPIWGDEGRTKKFDALAARLFPDDDPLFVHIVQVAAKLLDLDAAYANVLFYQDENFAAEFVALAAQGKFDEAKAMIEEVQ